MRSWIFFFLAPLLSAVCCLASSRASNSPPSSANCTSSCSSIHNVSFPFCTTYDCGLPEFRLNCSHSQALWWPASHPSPLYRVLAITSNYVSHGTFLVQNIQNVSTCAALTDPQHSSSVFGLDTPFGIEFGLIRNTNLVYGCRRNKAPNEGSSVVFNSARCFDFYTKCNKSEVRKTVPCVEVPDLEDSPAQANVSSVKEAYQCQWNISFFYSPTVNSDLVVQLYWSISQSYYDCKNCQENGGTCHDQSVNGSFRCECPAGRNSSTFCGLNDASGGPAPCRLHLCKPGVQFSIGASAIAVAIIFVGASFGIYCCCKTKTVNQLVKLPRDSSTDLKLFLAGHCGPLPQKTFSYDELLYATNSFAVNRTLGDGGFGTVYEGTLYNGQKVAVKRMYAENVRRLEQFLNEIRILSGNVDHPNLVKLYGFCCERQEDLLLVYEFVSNGTLAHHLHGHAGKGLLWETRLDIALETAQALAYLHSYVPPILHRDVKSTNILLDQNFHVKVADFGLSRFVPVTATHISTAPQGTPGYVDPEYHHCYQLNDKSDVYSFGVVLVELVSGKTPVDLSRDHMEINLSSLAVAKIQTGALDELIDPYLEVWRYSSVKEMVKGVAELAFQCLALSKDDRPSMKSVVEALMNIKKAGYEGGERKTALQFSVPRNSFDVDETSKLMETWGTPTSPSVQENWPTSSASISVSSSKAHGEKQQISVRSSSSS